MPRAYMGFWTVKKLGRDVVYFLWSDYEDYRKGLPAEHVVYNPEIDDGAHLVLCLQEGDFD